VTETSQEPVVDSGANLRLSLGLALGWVLPGAGHFFLGRRARGLLFATIVLASVGIGVALQGKLYTTVPGHPLSFLATLASMGMGAPYFLLRFLFGYQGDVTGLGYEYGTAFLLTAGLMNLLLVLDVADIARGLKG